MAHGMDCRNVFKLIQLHHKEKSLFTKDPASQTFSCKREYGKKFTNASVTGQLSFMVREIKSLN